ncbi:MAG: hypothetical protein H0U60_04635 [Blastocatellia bacterium]|nr:hypothetical protein [Blastocatellia bacterium]
MTDLLKQIDRRVKYLDAYLPSPAPHREYTNEQRMAVVCAVIRLAEAGLPTSPDPEKHARIMEIIERGRARYKKMHGSDGATKSDD